MANSPNELKNIQTRRNAYHRALGEFIEVFANAELVIQIVLWRYTGAQREVAQAAFGGLRVDAALSAIGRIFEVSPPPHFERTDFDEIKRRLELINGVRNMLLHYGVLGPLGLRDDMISSTSIITSVADRVREIPISVTILEDMTFDLRKIQAHLIRRHFDPQERGPEAEYERDLLKAAWRYKPPQQSQRPNKNRERAPRQQGPHGSSGA